MKKALEFLKKIKKTDSPYNFKECELDEAIAEIEVKDAKSCNGCKHDYDIENFDSVDGKRLDSFRPNECYVCSRNMNDRYENA